MIKTCMRKVIPVNLHQAVMVSKRRNLWPINSKLITCVTPFSASHVLVSSVVGDYLELLFGMNLHIVLLT
jgi:hypothetical protein